MRRIVVTGLGAITPLAAGVETSWSRLLAGRSGIQRLPDNLVGDQPAKIGGVGGHPSRKRIACAQPR